MPSLGLDPVQHVFESDQFMRRGFEAFVKALRIGTHAVTGCAGVCRFNQGAEHCEHQTCPGRLLRGCRAVSAVTAASFSEHLLRLVGFLAVRRPTRLKPAWSCSRLGYWAKEGSRSLLCWSGGH